MKHTGLKGETEGTHHSSTGSGIEHQILQQTHHQARNHCQTLAANQYLNRHNHVAA